MLEIIMGRN